MTGYWSYAESKNNSSAKCQGNPQIVNKINFIFHPKVQILCR